MPSPNGLAEDIVGFPTVLVAELEEPLFSSLSQSVSDEGYNVLEAHDWADALYFVKHHSRPVHLLLTNVSRDSPALAEVLRWYRPKLQALFIAQHTSESLPNALHPETALAKVQEFFKPLKATVP